MAKKLTDIENQIKSSNIDFSNYLKKIIPDNVMNFIDSIRHRTPVYLFSGIIRDYFLQRIDNFRDIDLIIEDELVIEVLFPDLTYIKNSFGGYKIFIDGTAIDLWVIKNTWALNQGQLKMSFQHVEHLPYTTFFNFSSIIYSLNTNQFIIGKPFLQFLRDKEINFVFKDNPYPELCIINSFYYSEKFNMKLSEKLKGYILENYNISINAYTEIQKKHYGFVKYSIDDLIKKINVLKK